MVTSLAFVDHFLSSLRQSRLRKFSYTQGVIMTALFSETTPIPCDWTSAHAEAKVAWSDLSEAAQRLVSHCITCSMTAHGLQQDRSQTYVTEDEATQLLRHIEAAKLRFRELASHEATRRELVDSKEYLRCVFDRLLGSSVQQLLATPLANARDLDAWVDAVETAVRRTRVQVCVIQATSKQPGRHRAR